MQFYENKDYEQIILGSMLLDNSIIEEVQVKVSSEYFRDARNRFIYKAILEEYRLNKNVEIIALHSKYKDIDTLYLSTLTDNITSVAKWTFYAEELRKIWLANSTIRDLATVAETIKPETVVENLHTLDSSITSYLGNGNSNSQSVKNVCSQLVEAVQKAAENNSEWLGIDCGWQSVNEIIDGLQLGKLVILGARPSMGKTSFALQWAANLCKQNIKTSFFSFETSALSLVTRLCSIESGIENERIKKGWFITVQSLMQKFQLAMSRIFDYDFDIDDVGPENEKDLLSRIRVQAKKGTKVFFIDHLGLIPFSDSKVKTEKQLDYITRELHKLCLELNITIICLCQLNRVAEGSVPTLAHLRDSGAIEQNADIVCFIHRDRATSTQDSMIETSIIFAKNRDGACGTAQLQFFPKCTRFVEIKKDIPQEKAS